MHRLSACALAVVFGVVSSTAWAFTAREILDRAKVLDDTTRQWTDRTQTMTLRIYSRGGGERRRILKMFDKRYPEGDKSISFFMSPPEIKGTGFLQWSHAGKDDDQWLYLPEFGRSRRITGRTRNQSFMGTDFTFRDLEILGEIQDWTEGDAPAKLVGSEDVDGHACHVIEFRPQQKDLMYSRLVLWMDKDILVSRKIDFYDRDGTHVKTLAQTDLRNIGPIPTAHHIEMRSLKKGSRTEAELSDVAYDPGLSNDFFTERYLKRGAP